MYETTKKYKFGSVEESIAIYIINRDRMITVMQALFSMVAPEKSSQLFRQFKGVVFPEEKYDEYEYIRKAKKYFDRIRNVVLIAKKAG